MKGLKENLQKSHVLIVGAGIIGKFIALELTELGYKVTIADPNQHENCSNAALGLLFGNIYQKRDGRSWTLRKQSISLWPQWIKFLQKFNQKLKIEKPLIQLTTKDEQFKKLGKFVSNNMNQGLETINNNSLLISNINKIFQINNLQGIISHDDGRIDPISLLSTIDIYLKNKNVDFLKDEITKINKSKKIWTSISKKENLIYSDAIILCNSLNALNFINNEPYKIRLKPILGQAIELLTDNKNIDYTKENTKYAKQNTKYAKQNTKYAKQNIKYVKQNTKYAISIKRVRQKLI